MPPTVQIELGSTIDSLVTSERVRQGHYCLKIGDIVLSHREKSGMADELRDRVRRVLKEGLGVKEEVDELESI